MRTFAFAAALAFSQIAGADDAERIVGTWKLVSVLYEDAQTRERVRAYRLEGNLLHLESPPQPHPNIGGRVVRIIVTWEKEE